MVWGKAGAVGLHVPLGQRHELIVQRSLGLVHKVLEITCARTHLLAYYCRAAGLDYIMQLPVGYRHGRAGDEYALGARRNHGYAVLYALLQLVRQPVAHLRAANRIVKEGYLRHKQHIASRYGQALGLARIIYPRHSLAFVVYYPDRLAQLFGGYAVSGKLLHLLRKLCDLFLPFYYVLLPLHLGNVHYIHGDVLTQYLIRLLLGVAGGLTDVHIRYAEEGAGAAESGAYRGLYERTGALWQHGLSSRYPELAAAAESGDYSVCGYDDLIRDVHAEGAEYLAAFLLCGYKLGRTDSVYLRYYEIPEIHGLWPVLLGKEHIPYRRRQHLAQHIMAFEIHSQIFPHLYII